LTERASLTQGSELGCDPGGAGGNSRRPSDADGQETREDGTSGWGEISEDLTSEADFGENLGINEPADPIEVTANSGALSGLDKSLAQPDGARMQDQREIRFGQSKIEGRKCKVACNPDQRPSTEDGASGALILAGPGVGLRAFSRPWRSDGMFAARGLQRTWALATHS